MKKYDTYKMTNFVLLDKIPVMWELQKIKFVATIYNGDSLNDDFKAQFESDNPVELAYISSKDINVNTSEVQYENGLRIPRDYAKFKIAPANSTLLCIEGGSAGRKITFINQDVFFVNKLACFNSDNSTTSKYLYYSLKADIFEAQFKNSITGMIGGVSIYNLKNFYLAFPPVDEQLQIVKYLDHKISLIDHLIKQKEKLIQLLNEKRQAVINEAVTKGLNPEVKMKNSGIEWMGKVPSHWKVARIGHYTRLIRGASPRPAGDPLYFGGDFMPWITVGEVTNGDDKFVFSTENYLTKEGSELSRIIYPETLLLSNSGATLGVPKISKIMGCINDGSVAFISLSSELERDFLFYFFKTHTEIYRQEMSGYGQPNLNTDIIKSTKFPLPPINEQIEIVKFIESEFLEFDKIISLSVLQIEKLKEYRQSIISEAVTGKVDVREWQPNKQQVA